MSETSSQQQEEEEMSSGTTKPAKEKPLKAHEDKSKNKHLMFKYFPDAFVYKTDAFRRHLKVVVEDGGVNWHMFYTQEQGTGEIKTGQDVYHLVTRSVDFWLQNSEADTYVLCLDMDQYVPVNKGPEQMSRTKSAKKLAWDGESTILEWDTPMPFSWNELNANRPARYRAMQEAMGMVMKKYTPPAGKRLIISGIPGKDQDVPVEIVADRHAIRQPVRRCEELRHQCGESDMMVFWWVKQLAQDYRDALIITTDTDLILLALLHSILLSPHVRMFISIGKREFEEATGVAVTGMPTVERKRKKIGKTVKRQEYININVLYNRVRKQCDNDLLGFITMTYIGGNDYCDSFTGITHDTLYKVFFEYHSKFGSLVDTADFGHDLLQLKDLSGRDMQEFVKLSRSAYNEFVKHLFAYRYLPKAEMARGLRDVTLSRVIDTVKSKNTKRPEYCVPGDAALTSKFLRVWWDVIYSCVGPYRLDLIPDPVWWGGWEPIDAGQPVTKANIKLTNY